MKRHWRRALSILLSAAMVISMAGMNPAFAMGEDRAENAAANMTALDALGIDASILPDGYDPHEQSNPYGKNTVTINPVSELLTWGNSGGIDLLDTTNPKNAWRLTTGLYADLYGVDYSGGATLAELKKERESEDLPGSSGTKYIQDNQLNFWEGKSYIDKNGDNLDFNDTADKTIPTSSKFLFSTAAAGNFTGAADGKKAQVAVLRSEALDNTDLSSAFDNSAQTQVGSGKLTLLFTDSDGVMKYNSELFALPGIELNITKLGNQDATYQAYGSTLHCDDFSRFTFQYQNYLQIAAGDFDNDGYDEVAVYIPDSNNPRVEVYKLQITSNMTDTTYKTASSWKIAWSYPLTKEYDAKTKKNLIPNMVSLTTGDFNRDGCDDLAVSYGHFYSDEIYSATRAAVLYGDSATMLQTYSDFPLTTSDGKDLVRVSFSYGNLTDASTKTLVLGGQVVSDIAAQNPYTRYVALYELNETGDGFNNIYEKNFNLFEKDSGGNYTYPIMSGREHGDIFYSTPLTLANLAAVTRGLNESALLYFDSLVFEYTDQGLELISALDNANEMHIKGDMKINPILTKGGSQKNARSLYVEFGADSADLFGNGYGTLVTHQSRLSGAPVNAIPLTVPYAWCLGANAAEISDYCLDQYANEFFQRIILDTNDAKEDEPFGSAEFQPSATNAAFCFLDCDDDTTYLQYTGEHYLTYSDPKVLAAVAAPPTFGDLLERDDLSGNYAESGTSYASSSGSGGGSTTSATITAGAYVSIEKKFTVFGVEVAKIENETVITGGCTWDFEKTSTMTQSVEYGTTAGSDAVAFYSIPTEIYGYTVFSPDGEGGYDESAMTITIPHSASVRVLELDDYEAIAKDYEELPALKGVIFTHDPYDPTTYKTIAPTGATVYNGDWSAVGYSSIAGGTTIGQTLSWEHEDSYTFTRNVAIENKLGGGAGGVTVGVVLGADAGFGEVEINMSGSDFSGVLQSMPKEAEAYGYGYNWKLCAYEGAVDDYSFPVVDYIVSDVMAPSPLPTDLAQSSDLTTDDQIGLTWTYDRMAAGFQLYRYYEFPDGSGSYELAFVPMTAGTRNADGTYAFTYIDENLDPYTEYSYQIQTVRAYVPNNSIPGEIFVARTKAAEGYPDIVLTGTSFDADESTLYVYPDATSSVVAVVENAGDYAQGVSYQWQMLSGGIWSDLIGKNTNTLTFKSAGQADQGQYRCRTNVIYHSQYITAYSDVISVEYNKRTPAVTAELTASVGTNGAPSAAVSLKSKDPNHNALPTGNVTFTITGADYEKSYTVALDAGGQSATASLPADATKLPPGVYGIEAFYAGSRVFKSMALGQVNVLSGDVGYLLEASNSESFDRVLTEIPYGDLIYFRVTKMTDSNGTTELTTGIYSETGGHLSGTDVAATDSLSFAGLPTDWDSEAPGTTAVQLNDGADAEMAALTVSIVKRPLTVSVETKTLEAGQIKHTADLPVITCSDLGARGLHKQGDVLSLLAKDTGGKKVTLNSYTLPGSYAVGVELKTGMDQYYELAKVIPGTLLLTGAKYQLTTSVPQVEGYTPGTMELAAPTLVDGRYNAGTGLYFVASPYTGYEVDSWTVYAGGKTGAVLKTQAGGNTFSHITKAEDTYVEVIFKKTQNTLTVAANPAAGGKVTLPPYFSNGAVITEGAQYTFTAKAEEGYTFSGWELVTGGSTVTNPAGTENEDGTSSVTITMPGAATKLYAKFTRNSYEITIGDGLQASYQTLKPDGSEQTVTFSGGKTLPGDTVLTVTPLDGRFLKADTFWTVNGNPTTDQGETFTYTVVEDAAITAETETELFDLTFKKPNPQDGRMEVTINGELFTSLPWDDGFHDLPSDSKIIFTVTPDYRMQVDPDNSWQLAVNGAPAETVTAANGLNSMTLTSLSGDTEVSVNLVYKQYYSVDVDMTGSGAVEYTLKDPDGVERFNGTVTEKSGFLVYAGSSMTFTGVPQNDGFMVGNWTINGRIWDSRATSYTFENITADCSATVNFIPKANYPVTFSVADVSSDTNDSDGADTTAVTNDGDDANGSDGADTAAVLGGGDDAIGASVDTLAATANGVAFISGAVLGSGSDLVFTPTLAEGRMVDHWTVKVGGGEPETVVQNLNQYLHELSFGLMGPTEVVLYTAEEATVSIQTAGHADFETIPDGVVIRGELVEATVTAADGFVLDGLTLTDGSELYDAESEAFVSYVQNNDGSITCSFYAFDNLTLTAQTSALHIITIETPANGTLTVTGPGGALVTGDTVKDGTAITITAVPAANYELDTLTVGGTAFASGGTYTVTEPVTIAATFQEKTSALHAITIEAPVNGTLTVTGPGGALSTGDTVQDGTTITVTAVPATNYELDTLTVGGTAFTSGGTYTVTEPVTIAATFKEKSSGGGGGGAPAKPAAPPVAEKKVIVDVAPGADGTVSGSVTIPDSMGAATVVIPYENPGPGSVVAIIDKDGGTTILKDCLPVEGGVQVTLDESANIVILENAGVFTDVPHGHWAGDSIAFVTARGLFNGTSGDTFSPDAPMTRAMLWTVLARLDGMDDTGVASWYSAAQAWAVQTDMSDGSDPGGSITREQLATMLWRYAGSPTADGNLDGFADAGSTSDYAKEALRWAVEQGIVSGKGNGILDPQGYATRAQVSAMLMRFISRGTEN